MSSTSDNPIPDDDAPNLGGGTVEERVAELESLAKGPPRLTDRLERLEAIVDANKLTAGEAGDPPHRRMARDEAGLLDKPLTLAINVLQNASIRLFGILLLICTILLYVAVRALGL